MQAMLQSILRSTRYIIDFKLLWAYVMDTQIKSSNGLFSRFSCQCLMVKQITTVSILQRSQKWTMTFLAQNRLIENSIFHYVKYVNVANSVSKKPGGNFEFFACNVYVKVLLKITQCKTPHSLSQSSAISAHSTKLLRSTGKLQAGAKTRLL